MMIIISLTQNLSFPCVGLHINHLNGRLKSVLAASYDSAQSIGSLDRKIDVLTSEMIFNRWLLGWGLVAAQSDVSEDSWGCETWNKTDGQSYVCTNEWCWNSYFSEMIAVVYHLGHLFALLYRSRQLFAWLISDGGIFRWKDLMRTIKAEGQPCWSVLWWFSTGLFFVSSGFSNVSFTNRPVRGVFFVLHMLGTKVQLCISLQILCEFVQSASVIIVASGECYNASC